MTGPSWRNSKFQKNIDKIDRAYIQQELIYPPTLVNYNEINTYGISIGELDSYQRFGGENGKEATNKI